MLVPHPHTPCHTMCAPLIEKSEHWQFIQGKAFSPPSTDLWLGCVTPSLPGGGVPDGMWLHSFWVTFSYNVRAVPKLHPQTPPNVRLSLPLVQGGPQGEGVELDLLSQIPSVSPSLWVPLRGERGNRPF